MRKYRFSSTVINRLGLLLLLVGATLGSLSVQGAGDPGEFLVSFGQRAVKDLNDTALSESEREQKFRILFNEAVDVPAIGRFVLGAHWRAASKEEREGFLAAFEDMALQRFLPMFLRQDEEYRGKSFDIAGVRYSGEQNPMIFIEALVQREKGEPVRLEWRLRERDGQLKILDISAEGISMALTLRQEYASAIRQTGSVTGLINLLRKKIKSRLPEQD